MIYSIVGYVAFGFFWASLAAKYAFADVNKGDERGVFVLLVFLWPVTILVNIVSLSVDSYIKWLRK